MTLTDWTGTCGVALLLIAYFMNLFGWLSSKSIWYAFLNTAGAAIAGYASWMMRFYPFVVLEGMWTLVSLISLVNAIRKN